MSIAVDRIEMKPREITIHVSLPKPMKISFIDRRPAWILAKLDDRVVGATFCDSFRSPTRIAFMFDHDGIQVPAYLEVGYGWRNAKSIRFVIRDKVIASEGEFKYLPQPALAVAVQDYSILEQKPAPLRVVVVLVALFFGFLAPVFLNSSSIESSSRMSAILASIAIATSVSAVIYSLKFPSRVDALMGPRHHFLSARMKLLNRTLISMMTGLLLLMAANIWIPVVNECFHDQPPVMLHGTLKAGNGENRTAEFEVEGRHLTFSTNASTAFGRDSEAYEAPAIRGSLGLYLTGAASHMRPELAVFLLENFKEPKWIRNYHIKTAIKIRDVDWLKNLATKWLEQCQSGLPNYCRLASYYQEEIHGDQTKVLLLKACEGADPIGCYGLTESVDASELEKKTAALKLLNLARAAKANCRCFWPAFNRYVDPQALAAAKTELCADRPKWMCP